MLKRFSLRVKLSLVVVLLFAGFGVFTAVSIFRLIRIDMAHIEKIRIISDLRLTLLYLDMKSDGGWRSRDGVLYKGGLKLSDDSSALEGIAPYLPPNIEFSFGAGKPPYYLPEKEGDPASFWLIRYILERTIKKYGGFENFDILKNVIFPADDEVLVTLTDPEGSSVGWIFLRDRGELKYEFQREFLTLFILVSTATIGVIVGSLYFIIFRMSAPIDGLVLSNKYMTKKNKELLTQARTDHLTGLLNRRGLQAVLKGEVEGLVEAGEAVSLALLDIDNFKKINDTYGHDGGDFVLLELGKLINASVRDRDTSIRWGGEEFLILFPGLNGQRTKEAADRLRVSIADHAFTFNGERIAVTVTIGTARCSKDCSFSEAVTWADKGLYFGKRHGKNCVCCGDDLENEDSAGA